MSALHVLGIVASPHGGGSTLTAMTALLRGAESGGAQTTLVDLTEVSTAEAIAAISAADAVAFGSPTYRAGHTSMLGALLERVDRGAPPDTTEPLLGKACAVVMTGASDKHFLATRGLRTVLTDFYGVQVLAPSLYLTHTDFDPGKQLTEQAQELVATHGRALHDLGTAVRASESLRSLRPLV